MEQHTLDPASPSSLSPPRSLSGCPNCGPVELYPVFTGELTNYYCPLCGTCWHAELGVLVPVDPATCPGCQIQLICQERRARS